MFLEEAWIRVRESGNTTVFEGTYQARRKPLNFPIVSKLRAFEGRQCRRHLSSTWTGSRYGPLGERGHVARNVSLLASDIRAGHA